MLLRTVMIFPYFDNMNVIEGIREKYDPLYQLADPHITLVFPFQDEMSNEELKTAIEECLKDTGPFELVLQGFGTQTDSFGNYLYLKVVRGAEMSMKMHDNLYSKLWNAEDGGQAYTPHMTVGKFSTPDEMNEAYEKVREIDDRFVTVVRKISVEMVGEREESIIIMEQELV